MKVIFKAPFRVFGEGICLEWNFFDMLAVDAAKVTALGSRLHGNSGSSLPGKAALMVSPSVLKDLASRVRKKIFAVCGTNGKTTTNNILCHLLEKEGNAVVCNHLGANMLYGVTGAFTQKADLTGNLSADYACIEVDEASAFKVFSYMKPDYLILTNLFRDQLDRYGEIDTTIEMLLKAIREVPEMKLIINGDDPLSLYLAETSGNPFITYGINEPVKEQAAGRNQERDREEEEVREGRFCKCCGAPLRYSFYHFGQMGVYECTACSFRRPAPSYAASGIRLEDGVDFSVDGTILETDFRGLYSVYNLLAVYSALKEDGHDCSRFADNIKSFTPGFGRNEIFWFGEKRVLLNLAKNPAGFNQNIDAMLEDSKDKDLIIAINDNAQDGKDISWLWDVEFDRVRDKSIRSITVTGIRALDMQLRLKYSEIDSVHADTPEEAIESYLASGCENLYILVNYTALFPIHRYLGSRSRKE